MLGELKDEAKSEGEGVGSPLLSEPIAGIAEWGGTRLEVMIRELAAAPGEPIKSEVEPTFIADGPKEIAPASAWPDLTRVEWQASEPELIGAPIALKSSVEMKDMGGAVHAFLAADYPEYTADERLRMAAEILARWRISPALTPADLMEIGDRLRKWASAKWPKAKWHKECPIFQRLDAGSITSGVTDLILETPEGLVVIDHKAYPGVPGDAAAYALGDAVQVQVYADTATKATGKPILGMYIHFPLIGALVSVRILNAGSKK
jgi:hypothetical protein